MILQGDNLKNLKKLEDNSVDSVVTDPPYGLSFMNKKWDYDVPSVEFWQEVYRVLKPGGHVLSFGGTRTYHRMVVNIEDAGFEIRDQIMWLYGSGFPKSHNIGKAVDKLEGNKREVVGENKTRVINGGAGKGAAIPGGIIEYTNLQTTKGSSQYEGWGTALKPAQEIVAVAQKPENLEGTALNLIYIIKKEIWKLYVKIVEQSSELNQAEQKEVLNIAQCLVEKNINIQDALQGLMDMSQLRLMENMNWSIVLLWQNILEDLYQKMNRYTTSTKSNLIIDLKTLKSLEWQNILENITQAKDNQTDGLNVNALTAVVLFNALNLKLKDIQQHSAEDNVIYKEDKMDCANEPICLARKPLSEKSVALNVLKWGTGGINVDGCRVGSEVRTTPIGSNDDRDDETLFGLNKKTHHERVETTGRFPANLILECICDEVIKGEKGEVKKSNNDKTWNSDLFGKRKQGDHYTDKGDIHTNPMCPCRLLDEQSGVSKSSKSIMGSAQSGNNEGRFPANLILECICDEVIKGEKGEIRKTNRGKSFGDNTYGDLDKSKSVEGIDNYNDKGDIHTNPNCPCRLLDEQSGVSKSSKSKMSSAQSGNNEGRYNWNNGDKNDFTSERGKGGASRFFYTAKVSKKERNMGLKEGEKSTHPTVKPVSLMTYLCRLITPKNGVVLDPFMGSGSTGIAARLEGFDFIGMEMEEDYVKIASARIENFEKYREFLNKK